VRLLWIMMLLGMNVPLAARPLVVVVTATAGFRHESIPAAESLLVLLAAEKNVELTFLRTEEEVAFGLTAARLDGVQAVLFVSTTGELPVTAAEAVVTWVRDGGTFAGIHSASDTWHSVPQYLEMLGGEFVGHPPETNAEVVVDDANHAATRNLPSSHVLFEEFYSLGGVDLSRVRMLLSLRARPEGEREPGYFPLAWEKPFGRGRVLYTALGHRDDVWASEWFRAHVAGIVDWALVVPSVRRRVVRH
jgi:type 1 glutamine amidotransferase